MFSPEIQSKIGGLQPSFTRYNQSLTKIIILYLKKAMLQKRLKKLSFHYPKESPYQLALGFQRRRRFKLLKDVHDRVIGILLQEPLA